MVAFSVPTDFETWTEDGQRLLLVSTFVQTVQALSINDLSVELVADLRSCLSAAPWEFDWVSPPRYRLGTHPASVEVHISEDHRVSVELVSGDTHITSSEFHLMHTDPVTFGMLQAWTQGHLDMRLFPVTSG